MDAVKTAVVAKPAPVLKTFEIMFAEEPTPYQMVLIYNEACKWNGQGVLKGYPTNAKKYKEEEFGYWVVSFEITADDWLFWCGFLSGRSLGISLGKEGDLYSWLRKNPPRY